MSAVSSDQRALRPEAGGDPCRGSVVTVILVLMGVTAAVYTTLWYVTRQRLIRHVTVERLRRRAEYENRLCARGDPRGFWGQWPPAPTHNHVPHL
jgi:hypothetical protein